MRRISSLQKQLVITLFASGILFLIAGVAHADTALSPNPESISAPHNSLLSISPPRDGEETTFFVEAAYDHKNRSSITAVRQFTGEKAYLYIDSAYLNGLSIDQKSAFLAEVQKLVTEFDTRIYPLVTQTFGTPWEPGIDGDLRITILLTQLSEQTAGYFNPRDEFPRIEISDSNEREMLYLNTRFIPAGRAKMFLAHEFQHLISFYWKDKVVGMSDDVWLNEVRSEYVPTLLGYDAVYGGSNLEHRVTTFLRSPSDSLTEWRNSPHDYGPIALFGQYLADQYSANIFREMMRIKTVGFSSLEEAAVAIGKPAIFTDLFTNWTIANYLNDISVDSRYGYFNSRLRTFHLSPTDIPETGEIVFTAKDWTNTAYRVLGSAGGILYITLTSPDALSAYRLVLIKMEGSSHRVSAADSVGGSLSMSVALSPDATYLLIPFSKVSTADFKDNDPVRTFTLRLSTVTEPSPSPISSAVISQYPEGSLLRARGDYKVYITKGQFKRHIVSADIFEFYGHLGFAQVIEVSPEELAQYKLSAWVRADGDPRVWEINGDGTKHWINIPGEQFAPSGRSWDGVYIINARERDWYVKGADVMR
ncbi:MAG: hypothetical protein Q7S09_03520 [bacterium]|nr:hypothetical protein [bacterium]